MAGMHSTCHSWALAIGISLVLPRVLAHCDLLDEICMTYAYMTNIVFKPSGNRVLKLQGSFNAPIMRASACAQSCASAGYPLYSLDPSGVCGCGNQCLEDFTKHGKGGYTGATAACFPPPSATAVGPAACKAQEKGKCPANCGVRNAGCRQVSLGASPKRQCCCTDAFPKGLYYNNILRACFA